ncbi:MULTISPECIES: MBL fold metallo-hydrolase [Pseudanabaena]|uniref:Beta-lactamase domain protein n=2 Tax=Pseudanabaena TaxID=1152 RepID=L8MT34_9CYAN|nr:MULTISPECIES: MBL fold metallo-hydrolase [Pseudanabaena]ELS31102.1 beta-lactamase domain protein [Pseudanabaena biceps PCC 7429]MDG3496639.1 MBL fold metallo-hydrolase [Pseudanabaena catenata USMAC16]
MLKKLKIKYLLAFLLAAIATIMSILLGYGWNYANAQAQKPDPTVLLAQGKPVETSITTVSLQSAGLQLQEVAQGVYALVASTDFPPVGPTVAICNGGFVIGSDGVLVIDPFQTPELAELMISTVKSLTDKPIRYVLNTHYHFDHTGGNAAFVKREIPVIGRGVIREYIQSGKNNTGGVTPPTVVINSQTDLWLGDRQVRIERVDGHSAGTDLVAYIPDAKVLFSGDMVFNKRIPYTGDSDIRQWQGSLYRLIASYPEAKVVPGHGDVTDVTGLQAQQAYFSGLERLALEWKGQILTKEQVLEKFAKVPDLYKDYKFKGLYSNNLESAYEQFTRSATIPLIP